MHVQDILDNANNLINFLESKGYDQEEYIDDKYEQGTYFKIDDRKLLVVYEAEDERELKLIKDHFITDRGLSYCIIFLNKKLLFFRNFGDKKYFIYSEHTKTNRSKIDKLEKIGESINYLFHSKDISKKFYESFKSKRNILVQSIENDITKTKKFLVAQKVFDRIFFIYFLCHKGIIKFEDGRSISGKILFNILLSQDNLFDTLIDLFGLFNTEKEDILKIDDYEIYVPFLNGGLFRLESIEQNLDVKIGKEQWEDIFEFLNRYHWIIEDVKDTEEDEEKILTPEILGHVYEQSVVEWELKGFDNVVEESLESGNERRKKGVYYTPETITDYISTKTIIPYLLGRLESCFNSFEELVSSNDEQSLRAAIEILENIKILDPACGSGAFLIKASEILLGLKRRLYYELKEEKSFYDSKLDIITENIYGVDILSGAVEISKLRLWLWLIAHYQDGKKIQPLPNIEYNIMCGNSLLGMAEVKGRRYLRNKEMLQKFQEFEKRKREYKTCFGDESTNFGQNLKNELNSLRSELNDYFILELNNKGVDIVKIDDLTQSSLDGNELPNDFISKKELEEVFKPFHWIMEFSEVFRGPKYGFDIIIGNPPYGNLLKPEEKKLLSFYSTINNNEIAANFVERCVSLLNNYSFFGQIIANSIAINKNTSSCRSIIREHFYKTDMALFGTRPAKIFQDAEIRVMIMIALKYNDMSGDIFTTDAIKLTQETKDNFVNHLKFENTSGLELGENKIGDGLDIALPKVGYTEIKDVLNLLKSKSNKTFIDLVNNGEYKLDFRKTGGYWLNALESFPYTSTKIVEMTFPTEIERDFAIILINSSLFYLFWSTYGNLRDLPPALFYKFPCPNLEYLQEFEDEIHLLKTNLNSCLLNCFIPDVGRNGEFRTAKCKNVIDEVDKLISGFYDLDDDLVQFIITYDNHIRPNES